MKSETCVLLLVFLVVGMTGAAEGDTCNFPPSLWCSSEEIITACQVEKQCHGHLHRTNTKLTPVDFTLYYETLCPDCQIFYKKQLFPTYKKIGAIMHITLVPYGNAHEKKSDSGKWEFQCQHGEWECVGNIIDACTINIVRNFSIYFPFINCMEEILYNGDIKPPEAAEKCAKKFDLKAIDSILACSKSDTGVALEHQMALRTDALKPQHTFVPWVTLNGVHNDKIQDRAEDDLLGLICDTYMGPKPPGCQKDVLKFKHHRS